ncbi:hypothetical protein [Cyanobium sp. NIES-981]|uniref:hypothetical protein n=1 Tax=Cyanobium sp. NIES-981 TaxID=1851505 RepID=UPI000B360883|nr:hypothetical protein [Cyanobium sp. NIES-981]
MAAHRRSSSSGCTPIIPADTLERAARYREALIAGAAEPGVLLAEQLQGLGQGQARQLDQLTPLELLGLLCDTRRPRIFAESEVAGDGSDWTLAELGLLGDCSMALPVTVFDNGDHTAPVAHPRPFPATLVFVAGALLRNDQGQEPADWREVVDGRGDLSPAGLLGLYRRRLLPLLRWINADAAAPRSALITVPGLGCGQFAGPFRGQLGPLLERVLRTLLQEAGQELPHIRAIHFDPWSACANSREWIHGLLYQVRPSKAAGNQPIPQLCAPSAYAGPEAEVSAEDFSACRLYSLVAWDHVSWPGNDFYGGARCTDDGVKAAATDAMAVITGMAGAYDPQQGCYLPPPPFRTWGEVVEVRRRHHGLRLWNPG